MSDMEIITIRLPRKLIQLLDDFVELGIFASRSEFIRFAIREKALELLDVYKRAKRDRVEAIALIK